MKIKDILIKKILEINQIQKNYNFYTIHLHHQSLKKKKKN